MNSVFYPIIPGNQSTIMGHIIMMIIASMSHAKNGMPALYTFPIVVSGDKTPFITNNIMPTVGEAYSLAG